ncbi:MAG: FKBP-type peptidyl-prolyl cis-trans isomerase [Candidatus Melainabacteria bacterium]|nr:FKBP-type peptidyl-prolyl cis-trans isomerase [Candidatus Melainabacteria bacterium]
MDACSGDSRRRRCLSHLYRWGTRQRGEPAVFPLNRVIAGWTEALQQMKVGDKWQVYIPPYLAYGEMGFGQEIGPNMALVFEIELLAINEN